MFDRKLLPALAAGLVLWVGTASAFSDTGQVNAEVDRGDPRIVGWASAVAGHDRGPMDYRDPGLGDAGYGSPADILGASGTPFSLGDGGWITVEMSTAIVDGAGIDFVVFENAFEYGGDVFGELVFVEVSSNGVDFARLPAINRITEAKGSYDAIDPSLVYNLAGQYAGGTGLDLADLVRSGHPLVQNGDLDLGNVRYVRLVDVIGDYAGAATTDHFGHAVSDPFPTAFHSGGADVTGVAVINGIGAVTTSQDSWGRLKALHQ